VARLGGDEFGLLLPETTLEAARAAVTKLRSTLKARMLQEGRPVTFSMGALTCLGEVPGPEALLNQADELMYRVKRDGKDNAIFDLMEDA
jgi:diguanylate cyclase (GGDEF)-like protein